MADEETKVFKCSICGADVEMSGALAGWAEKNPDKVKCAKCYAAKGKPKTDDGGAKKSGGYTKSSGGSATKQAITADALRKSYDEVVAAFADVLDDVKEYLGGWTTTVALSKTK